MTFLANSPRPAVTRVAVGEGPGTEPTAPPLATTAASTFLRMAGKLPISLERSMPERAWVAHQRRGEVGFDEDAAVGEQLPEQGLGLGVVGAEEGGVLAVLLDPLRGLLQDELLGAGHSDVGGRVGSGLESDLSCRGPCRPASMMAQRRLMVSYDMCRGKEMWTKVLAPSCLAAQTMV